MLKLKLKLCRLLPTKPAIYENLMPLVRLTDNFQPSPPANNLTALNLENQNNDDDIYSQENLFSGCLRQHGNMESPKKKIMFFLLKYGSNLIFLKKCFLRANFFPK